MNRGLLWITSFVLGIAAAWVTGFGILAALLFLLLSAPLAARSPLVVFSGLLLGFGAFWTFLMARQFGSGGTLGGGSTFWLALGIVPMAIGLVLLAFLAWRELGRRSATHTPEQGSASN
jgi:hypothetical protein